MVADEQVPRGIALLDAPDLDSVLESNRESAHRLLEAADLWLFVTTAARYGDALPWRVLQGAVERGASIAMVLNRVPPASLPTVRGDLLDRLRGHGLQGSPLFVVPDLGPHEGLLPAAVVAPIRRWLAMLAGPDRARTVIGRTLRGSLAALRPWVDELAEAVQAQADAAGAIAAVARRGDRGADRAGVGVDPRGCGRGRCRAGALVGARRRPVVRWAGGPPVGPHPGVVARGPRAVAAIEPLVEDLTRSAAATLTAAGAQTEAVLRAALTGPDAPAGGAVRRRGVGLGAADRPTVRRRAGRACLDGSGAARRAGGADGGPAETSPDGIARRAGTSHARSVAAKAEHALGDEGWPPSRSPRPRACRRRATCWSTSSTPPASAPSTSCATTWSPGSPARSRSSVPRSARCWPTLTSPTTPPSRLRLRLAVLKGLT